MLVPQTYICSAASYPSPHSEDGGASSVEEGVDAAKGLPLAPPDTRRCVLEGVGVASDEAAKRDRCAGGVAAKLEGVEDPPCCRLRRPPARAAVLSGEDSVLPMGLEKESSGEEGPENQMKRKEKSHGMIESSISRCIYQYLAEREYLRPTPLEEKERDFRVKALETRRTR